MLRNSMTAGLPAVLFFAVPAFAQSAPVAAQSISSEPGKVAMAEAVKVAAVVTAIDSATRTLTLKGPNGRRFDVIADDGSGTSTRSMSMTKCS